MANIQKTQVRVDPDPFIILLGVITIISSGVGGVALYRREMPPLPSRVRRKVLVQLASLDHEIRGVRRELHTIMELFERSEMIDGDSIRLGNGTLMSVDDFNRYTRISKQLFAWVPRVNRVVQNLERQTLKIAGFDQTKPSSLIGGFQESVEEMLSRRDLTIRDAREKLDEALQMLEDLIAETRKQVFHETNQD